MCGIVGLVSAYSNGFSTSEYDTFKSMLYVDGLRGMDSTGIFYVTNDEEVTIAKKGCNVASFMQESQFATCLSEVLLKGQIAVGHNRAATRGAVNDNNAHPFCVDNEVVLVHNGTWYGDHKQHKNVEVDSLAIAHILHENADNLEAGIAKIHAAYALVWYNVKKKELYLIRNKDRPLYTALTKDEGMVFASEADFILFAASRNNLKLKEKPYLIEENVLVTIKPEGGSWTLTNTKMQQPKKCEVKAVQPRPTGTTASTSSLTGSINLYDHIHKGACSNWHTDDLNYARLVQAEYATIKKDVTMEMMDFHRAENKEFKECTKWHVIFSEVKVDDLNKGPVFWALVNKTHKEILDMMEKPFIKGNVGSPIIHQLVSSSGKQEWVVTINVTHISAVAMEEYVE